MSDELKTGTMQRDEARDVGSRRTRRSVLAGVGATALLGGLPVRAESVGARQGELRLGAAAGPEMRRDFVGLSYESAQLGDADFFAADNRELVTLFRALGETGVLRIGGNSSEFCWWRTSDGDREPVLPESARRGTTYMPHRFTAIEPCAIDRLAGFLDATGWKLIYGLNLGTARPEAGAEEAAYVARGMGARLLNFQIGNEPDLYGQASNGLRGAGWDFDRYLDEWTRYAQAVLKRVPEAQLAGPDVASNVEWVKRFAEEAPQRFPGHVVECTGHYYAEGPPESPGTTMERLLTPDARLARDVAVETQAAARARLAFRMTEANSCYRGGKWGMSDAFGSALWAAEFLLELASAGVVGANLHGGGGKVITSALGDHEQRIAPGATAGRTERRELANRMGSAYTPIAGSRETGFVARPVCYGMKVAGLLAGGRMRGVTLREAGSAVGWAAEMPTGETRVVVVNPEPGERLVLRVESAGMARVWRLEAADLAATAGVRLAGAAMDADGVWRAKTDERVTSRHGSMEIAVPGASAAVIFLDSAKS